MRCSSVKLIPEKNGCSINVSMSLSVPFSKLPAPNLYTGSTLKSLLIRSLASFPTYSGISYLQDRILSKVLFIEVSLNGVFPVRHW